MCYFSAKNFWSEDPWLRTLFACCHIHFPSIAFGSLISTVVSYVHVLPIRLGGNVHHFYTRSIVVGCETRAVFTRIPNPHETGKCLCWRSFDSSIKKLKNIGQLTFTFTATMSSTVQQFRAEYDDEGVYVYQAFNSNIADWAIEHQTFADCPFFKPTRMTWIKPSFAWVLYRSGYGRKRGQERILKIKLDHSALRELLSRCVCGRGHGGTFGRIQWDPERDMMTTEKGREPRKMLRTRAIQIGLAGPLSKKYVEGILKIEDVMELARLVGQAHEILAKKPKSDAMEHLLPPLPVEEPYIPAVSDEVLAHLALAPGSQAEEVARIGYGKATPKRREKVQ